jgi:hypothetical protein
VNASPVPHPISLHFSGTLQTRSEKILQRVKFSGANGAPFGARTNTLRARRAPATGKRLNSPTPRWNVASERTDVHDAIRPSCQRPRWEAQFTRQVFRLALKTSRRALFSSKPAVPTLKPQIR